jgi:hypothetical protein
VGGVVYERQKEQIQKQGDGYAKIVAAWKEHLLGGVMRLTGKFEGSRLNARMGRTIHE